VEFFWFKPTPKIEAYLDAHPELVLVEDKAYQALPA
jgi:hypothetical protein